MSSQYLYSVELTINDCDLWTYPDHVKNVEDKKTFIRFKMNPSICLEITEDEFLDQINCDKVVVKNTMFSLNRQQINSDVSAKIVVSKLICKGQEVVIGSYNISNLHCSFKRIAEQFDLQEERPCAGDPCVEIVKELVQLVNDKDQPSGSIHYTLRLACFGPTISKDMRDDSLKAINSELTCLSINSKQNLVVDPKPSENIFNEYAAEVNGNQLIIRVLKGDKSRFVTQVFDNDCSPCDEKPTKSMSCKKISTLTDFQRKTSCIGKSFKNSCRIPAIRGNLKYPGKLDNNLINFNVHEAYEKNDRSKPRTICLQAEGSCLKSNHEVKSKLPKGVEINQKACIDPDTDVFILKIGKKSSCKNGKNSGIELEMRTPKRPDNEVKKMETREVQVDEKEFEVEKKPSAKNPETEKMMRGFVKKSDVVVPKGLKKKIK